MELFIKVYFWIALVGTVIRFFIIGYSNYPRKIERGADTIALMLALPFLAWAAYLVWA